jgi:hypothetical protein
MNKRFPSLAFYSIGAAILLYGLQSANANLPYIPPHAIATACLSIEPDGSDIAHDEKHAVAVLHDFVIHHISGKSDITIFLRASIAKRNHLKPDFLVSTEFRQYVGKLFWKELGQAFYLGVVTTDFNGSYKSIDNKSNCDVDAEIHLDDPLTVCAPNRFCIFTCDANQCKREGWD